MNTDNEKFSAYKSRLLERKVPLVKNFRDQKPTWFINVQVLLLKVTLSKKRHQEKQ